MEYLYDYAPGDYYPKFLAHHEIKQSNLIIANFFSFDGPVGYRKYLKMWMEVAISETAYTNESLGPVFLFMVYEHNVRLVEALHLLLLAYPGWVEPKSVSKIEQIKAEKQSWRWFPKGLSQDELINPFLIIAEVFEDIKMPGYRDELHEWFIQVLSTETILLFRDHKALQRIYKKQLRLLDAAWLIKQRELPFPALK